MQNAIIPFTSQHKTNPQHDPETIAKYLLLSEGNLELAAERMQLTPSDLLLNLLDSPDLIIKAVKLSALVSTLRVLNQTRTVLEASLADLEPKDTSKLFTNLIQSIASLTPTENNTNINVTELLMKVLPPDVRNAVREITLNESDTTT